MLDHRIYTFLMLYDEMNYRRTAEKLNMTQPGVTQHIQFLEYKFGVKLFEYDGRSLKKTKYATLLKNHLNSIQTEIFAMKQDFSIEEDIKLRVGATKTIGEYVIVPQIRNFLTNKRCSLKLIVDNTEVLLELLENVELDFAIIEGVFDKNKYGHHLFKKESFVGICSTTHPFAGKSVSLSDAFKEQLIVRENGSGTRKLLEQAIIDRGFSLQSFSQISSISNFSVICDVVAYNNAITFAYEPIAHSHPNLAIFEIEDMKIQGEFNYVYCNENIAKQKIELFLNQAMTVVEDIK